MDPQIQLHGNLVADPTYQVTAGGAHMAKFRLASSGRRFDRQTSSWVSTNPVYLSVVCWRQLADNVARSLRKGDSVLVHGRLTFSEYDDKHGGPRRQSYAVEATTVGPDLSRYRTELIRPVRDVEPEPAAADDARPVPADGADPWGERPAEPAETAA